MRFRRGDIVYQTLRLGGDNEWLIGLVTRMGDPSKDDWMTEEDEKNGVVWLYIDYLGKGLDSKYERWSEAKDLVYLGSLSDMGIDW